MTIVTPSLSPRAVLVAVLLGACMLAPRYAEAANARVRWLPSSSAASVTSYRVYVRNAGSAYGSAAWTGNPAPATDGSISATVPYTPAASGVNYFTVVAVGGTGGVESGLSQELPIGTPNACRIDSCSTKTSCTFATRPNGSACPDAAFCNGDEVCQAGVCVSAGPRDCSDPVACSIDSCNETTDQCVHVGPPGCCLACDTDDPCLAEACAQGDCSAPAGEDIEVNRLKMIKRSTAIKVAGKASFFVANPTDPTVTGLEIALLAADGAELFSSIVPSHLIHAGASPGRYRFTTTRARSEPMQNGISRVDFRVKGDVWFMSMQGETTALEEAFVEPTLTWVVRMGSACARRLYMECNQTTSKSVCR